MRFLEGVSKAAHVMAAATDGSPLRASLVLFTLYSFFTAFERQVEELLWGEGFLHWGDPVIVLGFIAFDLCVILACAEFRVDK